MSFYLKALIAIILFSFAATSAFAADSGPGPAGIPQIEYMFARVVCVTVPLGYIALLVILIIAGFKYLISGEEPKAISSAHQTVTWGILGILFLTIAWLVLLLIQNFTGVKVTEFTLSSLPGVQGFTGSCWAEPPVAPEPPKSTPAQQALSQECIPNKWFTEINSDQISTSENPTLVSYTDENSMEEFKKVATSPRWVLITSEERIDNNIYQLNAEVKKMLAIKHPIELGIPDVGKYYGKFKKGQHPSKFYKAVQEAREIALSFADSDQPITLPGGPTFSNNQLFVALSSGNIVRLSVYNASLVTAGPFRIECPDADYYNIAAYSPLIYLYPQQTTATQVKINSPLISLKLPLKTNSWDVTAFPNGTLETQEGKKHPYIPYEFLRSDFKRPVRGFVIEGSKLEEYLRKDLWKKLGLTDSEINDYWQDAKPRVKPAQYYFISLIDRSEIDRVLPMEVNPKPDTIIRNMTYILPLSTPFTTQPLEEEKLIAPERKGFTVLENGVFTDGF